MICITLKTEMFPNPHNKHTIANNISQTLKSFDLENKDIVVVSDGASNIVAATKLLKMKRLGCSAHSLHRFIVHDILKNEEFLVFLNTVHKLKRIYKCLNYNTSNIIKIQNVFENEKKFTFLTEANDINSVLEIDDQFQTGLGDFEVAENVMQNKSLGSLKNSNDTRWNTLCTMFRSFNKNQQVINIALGEIDNADLTLNRMEKELMQEFLKFLEIFEDATKYLQGRKYPTLNTNIVFLEKIHDTIQEKEKTICFEECIKMYSFSEKYFSNRFKIFKIHLVAALLDPMQKTWKRLDKWLKRVPTNKYMDLFEHLCVDDPEGGISRKKLILMEVMEHHNKHFEIVDNIPTTSRSSKKQKFDMPKIRNNIASFIAATSAVEEIDPIEQEIEKYFLLAHEDDCETLSWWEKNEKEFPNIARLAQSILSIPSTSASCEEAFSSAGSLITAKRSNLHSMTVERILFIHDNYELFKNLTN